MVVVAFSIDLEPITKKNSMRLITSRKSKRPMLLPSKQYMDYEAAATSFCPELLIDFPVNIEAHYFRKTRRRVDITNLESALLDLLVHAGTLEDDNCSIVVSTDGSRVHYDKDRPRTEVIISTSDDVEREFLKDKGGKNA